ncbi:MAG: DUF438 domain-containing protein [Epulopiscium sp.]|nr:DUF438 domain-containing protein [Candidatus Epulonipiscium sp.]
MSEMINNREHRQKVLKEIIKELHDGKTVEEVKTRFEKLIEGIEVTEITQMEQALIMEGMPVKEIQRLCDVHAAVFKGSIEEIHRPEKEEEVPGHPVHTFRQENKAIEKLIKDKIEPHLKEFEISDRSESLNNLIEDFDLLWEIDKHYLRKENIMFPFMEKYGITAPPQVMWGVDDEIRGEIKEVKNLLSSYNSNKEEVLEKANNAVYRVNEMIFKEENILFPMALETLVQDEWLKIAEDSDEIGYSLIDVKEKWTPRKSNVEEKAKKDGEHPSNNGYIKFDAGILLPEEINSMLNTLPFDITFVDKDGYVKYFSQGKERIFPRTRAAIGREVKNCHPPGSVHIVEQIIEDLMNGKKDHEDFWIKMKDMYVFIRYFAVRDESGEFLGVMEVSQNIKPIQEITGEKRLLSE